MRSCSDLRIYIKLLCSYFPLNLALQGEVALLRVGNRILCAIDLEFLRASFTHQCPNGPVLQATEIEA